MASHDRISCWSKKNIINPRMIFKGSETYCMFDCNLCHTEFQTRAYNILTGYWCPYCKKKTESKMLEFLSMLDGQWKPQQRFNWCTFSKSNHNMPIDFASIETYVVIEIDGPQHFTQVSNWNHPDDTQEKDIEKIKHCINQRYSIIHISQEDIWNDLYDWKTVIKDHLYQISEHPIPSCYFISKKSNLYDSHIRKLGESVPYQIIHPI
jgi:hypothetical protein